MLHASDDRADQRDAGFTLVEVVVAMAVFAVMVTAALGVILGTTGVLRSNSHRVTAANLSTTYIEAARSLSAQEILNGASTTTETVGGTAYTVTQNANYVVSGTQTSACRATGDKLAYKLVTVTVTWPDMGSVAPVRSESLRSLGLGSTGLDATLGSLAVSVVSATGDPVADAAVTLSPSGGQPQRTGHDGCVVFTDLSPLTTYTATAQRAGYVGTDGAATASAAQGVHAGGVDRVQVTYDAARSAPVQLAVPAGHSAPAALPLRYRTSFTATASESLPLCSSAPSGTCVTGLPGTLERIFPTVHELWAGSCADARSGSVTVDLAGSPAPVSLPLVGVRVRVRSTAGALLAGRSVTAKHAPDTASCTAGESWALPTTGPAGSLGALPPGTWTFSTPSGTAAQAVTLAAGQPVQDVALTVTG